MRNNKSNDRAFAIYALTLVGAVVSLFATVVALGFASPPGLAFTVEHVGLGLLIRTSYKSLDGGSLIADFLRYTGWMSTDEGAAPAGAMPSAA